MDITTDSPTDHTDLIPTTGDVLITGWEPELPAGDSLLRNYVVTLSDRLLLLARASRARVERDDEALYVDLDSTYVFDNIVVPNGFLTDEGFDRVMARARSFFPPGRAWSLQALSPAADLGAHGLVLLGHPPLMYRPAGGRGPVLPDRLEIRPVATVDELDDFEATLAAGYPLPAGSAVLDPRVLEAGFRGWVGYVDGLPVATAGSHTAAGLTEVEWVATLSEWRGRGIGAAMTWAATAAEPETAAVLVATDDGRPVYQRLGYIPLMRLAMWFRP